MLDRVMEDKAFEEWAGKNYVAHQLSAERKHAAQLGWKNALWNLVFALDLPADTPATVEGVKGAVEKNYRRRPGHCHDVSDLYDDSEASDE